MIQIRMDTIYTNAGLRTSEANTTCVMMTIEELGVKLLQSARSLLRFPYHKSSAAWALLVGAESRDGCSSLQRANAWTEDERC